jgi:hypothetical protein
MKIVNLIAENFKRLKAIEITPNGNIVQITGRNEQGKSSVLDAICAALGGEKWIDPMPIREGETHAEIVLDLGDIIVKRTFSATGGSLRVTPTDGKSVLTSPQKVLDKLVGKIAFDPIALDRKSAEDQKAELLKVVDLGGVDLNALQAKRDCLFAERTSIGKERDRLKASAEMIPVENAPQDEISISDLSNDLRAKETVIRVNESKRQSVELAREKLQSASSVIADIERRIENLNKELSAARLSKMDANSRLTTILTEVETLVDPETSAIQKQIEDAEVTNDRVRRQATRRARQVQAEDKAKEYIEYSNQIAALDQQKADILAAANFPVPHLSFSAEGILYKQRPIAQASASERRRVWVGIAMALNPKLSIVLIDDGETLDSTAKKDIFALAEEKGFQVWMTSVDESGKVGLIIEDGLIQNAKPKELTLV